MSSKQLSIPGLPVPEPKQKLPTQDERVKELADRVLSLELEVLLLRVQVEKGDKDHA